MNPMTWRVRTVWWLVFWGAFYALIFVGSMPHDSRLSWFAVAGMASSLLPVVRPEPVVRILGLGLIALLILGVSTKLVADRALVPVGGRVDVVGLHWGGPVQELRGIASGFRTWSTPRGRLGEGTHLCMRSEVRLLERLQPLSWEAVSGGAVISPVSGSADESRSLRAPGPGGGEASAGVLVIDAVPLAGRVFRALVEFRAESGWSDLQGVLIQLSDIGGVVREFQYRVPGDDWQTHEIVLDFPDDHPGYALALVLARLQHEPLLAKPPRIEEYVEGSWRELSPGAMLMVELDGSTRVGEVRGNWAPFAVAVPWSTGGPIVGRFVVGSGTSVQIRATRVVDLGTGSRLHPIGAEARLGGLFLHPNVLGHAAAMMVIALMVVSRARPSTAQLMFVLLGLVTVVLTGSRAAILVLVGACAALMYLEGRPVLPRRYDSARLLMLLGAALLSIALLASANPYRRVGLDVASRAEIWATALRVVVESAPRAAPSAFSSYWSEANPGRAIVTHAHNLWLQMALDAGAAGIVAGAWLGIGLLLIARHWGSSRGLVLVVSVLLLNVVDVSMFFVGVFAPVLMTLNALGAERRAGGASG